MLLRRLRAGGEAANTVWCSFGLQLQTFAFGVQWGQGHGFAGGDELYLDTFFCAANGAANVPSLIGQSRGMVNIHF